MTVHVISETKGRADFMLENKIDKDLLSAVAGLHEVPMGAYNIRKNGEGMVRK